MQASGFSDCSDPGISNPDFDIPLNSDIIVTATVESVSPGKLPACVVPNLSVAFLFATDLEVSN